MNFLMPRFTPEKLVPQRQLDISLSCVHREVYGPQPPFIKDERLYYFQHEDSIYALDERDFSLVAKNNKKPYARGLFGINNNTLMSRDEGDDDVYELSLDDLRTTNVFKNYACTGDGDIFISDNDQIIDFKVGSGIYAESHIIRRAIKEDEIIWRFERDLGQCWYSCDREYVAILDSDGKLYLLDYKTGNIHWEKTPDDLGIAFGDTYAGDDPHLYKDLLVTKTVNEQVIGIELKSGQLAWKRAFENYTAWFPCATQSGKLYTLYEIDNKYFVLEVDMLTGSTLNEWLLDLQPGNPLKDKGSFTQNYCDVTTTHYWGATNTSVLFAMNLSNGKIEYTYELDADVTDPNEFKGSPSPFVICNNRLYVSTSYAHYVFEGAGGYRPD